MKRSQLVPKSAISAVKNKKAQAQQCVREYVGVWVKKLTYPLTHIPTHFGCGRQPALVLLLSVCGLVLTSAISASALSISPAHSDVMAGDTGVFVISGLPTDTNYAPAQVYLTSFDPSRLEVISPSPLSQITTQIEVWVGPEPDDTVIETIYHPSLPVSFAAWQRIEGLFDPIPVSGYVVRRSLHDDTVQFIGYVEAAVSVIDPILMLHPDTLAVQAPNVRPVVLQRSIHAFASLTVTLRSDIEHVLGLGATADPGAHSDQLTLTFNPFEVNKTFYISGHAMAEDADSITGTLSAQVGSYLHDRAITVTRHPSVILQPVPYSGLGTNRTATLQAGDAFNLLVRRTSDDDKLVSDYTVTLTSDRPSVAGVPETVVIPAGAREVAFTVSARKPGETVIRATGPNAETVAESAFGVVVEDPALVYTPPSMRIDEGDEALLTVTRLNKFSGADLVIDLESMAPALFQPAAGQLTIPAGLVSASIAIEGLAEGSNYLAVAVGTYRANIPVRVAAAMPGVRVFLEPSEAQTDGAAWRVAGGPWRGSGSFEPLDPGNYDIDFSVIDGWITPDARTVTITEASTTNLTATYIRTAGIRLHLESPEAIVDGAQWRIAGGSWRDSGDFVPRAPGAYQIEYRDIGDHWVTPSSQTILVPSQTIVEETAAYVYASGVSVDLEPGDAVAAGARWRLAGGDWHEDGAFEPAEPGEHTIEFMDVDGWLRPAVRTVTVLAEQAARLSATYRRDDESGLIVYLMPPGAASAGARWRIEGDDDWRESGAFSARDPGEYRIEFREIEGWLTPPWVNVDVGPDVATPVTANYLDADVDRGLAVYLYPPTAVDDGGAWRVAGSEWQGSGSLLELDDVPDDLSIEFRPAPGWLRPVPITISELSSGVTVYSRTYYRGEAISQGRGDDAGWFEQPTGMAFDSAGRLVVADSRNHRLQRREADDSWTVIGGPGSAPGQLNEPFALVIDAQDGYYVGEIGNNRIQYRSAGGAWSVLADAGSGLGSVNGPFDLDVDAQGNLYVADLYNNRVQRRAPDGTWSVFIDPGKDDEAAWMPSGLTVWNDRLALADFMVPGHQTRVMLFEYPDPDEGTLIGSSAPDEGNLKRLYGLTGAPGNRLLGAGSVNQRIVVYPADDPDPRWRVLVGDILTDPRAALWRHENGVDYCYIADTGNHRILRVGIEIPSSGLTPASAGVYPLDREVLNLRITREREAAATIQRTPTDVKASADQVVVRWPGQTGTRYTLQSTVNPLDPSAWETVSGAVLLRGYDGIMEYKVSNDFGTATFYRVIGYQTQ